MAGGGGGTRGFSGRSSQGLDLGRYVREQRGLGRRKVSIANRRFEVWRAGTYLAGLVLRHLVGGVLAALLALAVGVPGLGDVDL